MKLVGRIDWSAGVIINPLDLDFSQFKKAECEHCHTNRYRCYTQIIMKDDGTLMQVGTGCVKEILGYEPSYIESDEDEMYLSLMFGYNPKQKYYDTRTFVCGLIRHCKQKGFSKELSLEDLIGDRRTPTMFTSIIATKEEYDETKKLIKYFADLDTNNQFVNNVKSLVTSDTFHVKYFNIIKYAYKIYFEAINYKPELNSVAVDYTELTIESINLKNTTYTTYGYSKNVPSYKYLIIDDKGNAFLGSSSKELNFKKGDRIKYRLKKYPKWFSNDNMNFVSRKYGIVNEINFIKEVQ